MNLSGKYLLNERSICNNFSPFKFNRIKENTFYKSDFEE